MAVAGSKCRTLTRRSGGTHSAAASGPTAWSSAARSAMAAGPGRLPARCSDALRRHSPGQPLPQGPAAQAPPGVEPRAAPAAAGRVRAAARRPGAPRLRGGRAWWARAATARRQGRQGGHGRRAGMQGTGGPGPGAAEWRTRAAGAATWPGPGGAVCTHPRADRGLPARERTRTRNNHTPSTLNPCPGGARTPGWDSKLARTLG